MKFTLKNQDEMLAVWRVKQWVDLYNPEILEAEQTVYNFELNEAGTIDAVVKFDNVVVDKKTTLNGIYVLDFKTGKSVSDEAYLQLASYRYMYSKLYDVEVAGAIILHTSARVKKPIEGLKMIVISAEECDEYFKTHKIASELWLRKNPGFAPKVFEFPESITL